jgi:hypothetical protein
MFSDTKNRTGMAGSGKTVSGIVEFPKWGLLMGNMWCYSVQEIVQVNTLIAKMPSVLYSSL